MIKAAYPSQQGKAQNPALFKKCVAASAALHGLLWLSLRGIHLPQPLEVDPVEVDLTKPLGTGPGKLGAPKKLVPNAVPQKKEVPPPEIQETKTVTPVVPVAPPKDWVLPGADTKVIEKPAPPPPTPGGAVDGTGTASKLGGSGTGLDDGCPGCTGDGGSALLSYPKLLNRDEVLANIRRFYPEKERRAGREASVMTALHVGTDGRVSSVDIINTGGPAFDGAAKQVAALMRFSPAMAKSGKPVAVKLKQAMEFYLQDEE